jgi:hypothetical protein
MPLSIDDIRENLPTIGKKKVADKLNLQSGAGQDRIRLDAGRGDACFGGNGQDGDVYLFAASGDPEEKREATIHLDGQGAEIIAGGNDTSGNLTLLGASGETRVRLNAGGANLWLGGNGQDGDLIIFASDADPSASANASVRINGEEGNYFAGGNGTDGDITLRATDGTDRIRLDAGGANAWLGGNGADGDLLLFSSASDPSDSANATVVIDGEQANYFAGGHGTDGDITLRADDGSNRIRLDAGAGNIWLGGNGADGDLVLFAADGDNSTTANSTIHLNGDAGDIVLRNADCAEEFEVAMELSPEKGAVMVIGDQMELTLSTRAYDSRVAGIIAGAGTERPGIVLGRREDAKNPAAIALSGRVFCQVDARDEPIKVGDLLTTSDLPGHAMKASDHERAFGAVIGKALEPLESGCGLITVLVALQ